MDFAFPYSSPTPASTSSITTTRSNGATRYMKHNDLVILYFNHDDLSNITLIENTEFDNRFGHYRHNDFIGKAFGSKIYSTTGTGYMYALLPTPELWSVAFTTRTQIVDSTDCSVCTSYLDLYPGCKVVESGTGSGCMSLSILRAIAPLGHLFTYEYNPVRANMARDEFKSFGLEKFVTVQCHDICGKFDDGNVGGFPGVDPNSIDAVFLDVPDPWLAIKHAHQVLKQGRKVCCYSPCIEQVSKTCEVLRSLNFHSIYMIEVRAKLFDGRNHKFEEVDVGRSTSSTSTFSNNDSNINSNDNDMDDADDDVALGKRSRIDVINVDSVSNEINDINTNDPVNFPGQPVQAVSIYPVKKLGTSREAAIARPIPSMKGHTAFLTFAVKSSDASN